MSFKVFYIGIDSRCSAKKSSWILPRVRLVIALCIQAGSFPHGFNMLLYLNYPLPWFGNLIEPYFDVVISNG